MTRCCPARVFICYLSGSTSKYELFRLYYAYLLVSSIHVKFLYSSDMQILYSHLRDSLYAAPWEVCKYVLEGVQSSLVVPG